MSHINQNEQKVLSFVNANPGLESTAIQKALNAEHINVALILFGLTKKKLICREKIIKKGKAIRRFRYYPKDQKQPTLPLAQKTEDVIATPAAQESSGKIEGVGAAKFITEFPIQQEENAFEDRSTNVFEDMAFQFADKFASLVSSRIAAILPAKIASDIAINLELAEKAEQLGAMRIDIGPLIERIKSIPDANPEPAKVRKPRIGVIGLLPIQNGEVSAEFGDVMDLTFAAADQIGVIKSMAKSCDVVFLHTKHCSHTVTNIITATGVPFHNVQGSLSSMKDALMEFYSKQPA